MKCAECKYIRTCKEKAKEPNLGGCTSGIPIEKMGIKTNGDRIRKMTNDELADIIMCPYGMEESSCGKQNCFKCCREWLESEVDNG